MTAAFNEVQVRQAMIACALERFRIAHGKYPATLDQLVPQFLPSLPVDPFGGVPFRYSLRSDEQFSLYSIGWNQTDDRGQSHPSREQGDWVWNTALGE